MEAQAELADHTVQRCEHAVADVVLPQVIPEVFHGVEFWAVGRQGEQMEGRWHAQIERRMPAQPAPSRTIRECSSRNWAAV
jgi:hypothetical protein